MREFSIMIRSLQDVQDFVSITIGKSFDVQVGNDMQCIDGKDFMGMFSLDYRYPQRVRADCSEEEFECFRREAAAWIIP